MDWLTVLQIVLVVAAILWYLLGTIKTGYVFPVFDDRPMVGLIIAAVACLIITALRGAP